MYLGVYTQMCMDIRLLVSPAHALYKNVYMAYEQRGFAISK